MGRNAPSRKPERLAAVRERDARALELAKTGASMAAVAAALGYANASGAWKAVQRGLAAIPKQAADELRQMQQERLGDLYRHTLQVLANHHPVLYKGKPVVGADGRELEDDSVRLEAIKTLLRVDESFRRLNGLDLPRKVEVSGPDGEPIPVEVTAQSVLERIRQWDPIDATAVELPEGNGNHA